MKQLNFEPMLISGETSFRGGRVDIDLGKIYKKWQGEKMCAYQNYLGGGLLGRINSRCTIDNWGDDKKLPLIALQLKQYLHSLTNHSDNEWENQTFEENQKMVSSAY